MPSQIIFFSQPRSGCHMLERMLFDKQAVRRCWHPLCDGKHALAAAALFEWLQNDDTTGNARDLSAKFVQEVEKGVTAWQIALQAASKHDEILYVHDHSFYMFKPERMLEVVRQDQDKTLLANRLLPPNATLLYPGTVPLFSIRHPVLSVPSSYLANSSINGSPSRANNIMAAHVIWTRDLYDWYRSHGVEPVVADADDYMTSEDFVRHLASKLGLDPAKVAVSWPKLSDEERAAMHPQLLPIQKTLYESEGLVPGRASSNIDLEAEKRKWEDKFNAEEIKWVKEMVDLAMPHYEYLRERRLRM